MNYFTSQYRKMFEDHLDECMKHFERYTGGDGPADGPTDDSD